MVSIELSSRVYPGFAVVALAGELDAASVPAAAAAIQEGVGPGRRVIVDLGAVQFAACHALGALAVAAKRTRRAGGGVLLAAPQAAVLRVLELTGLAGLCGGPVLSRQGHGRRRRPPRQHGRAVAVS